MKRDLSAIQRVVVKVGTNLLSTKDGIDEGCIDRIAEQLVLLQKKACKSCW